MCQSHGLPNGSYLYQSYITTVFTLEEALDTQYLFRSEDTYYYFLLQHFLVSKPNIPQLMQNVQAITS